MGSVETVAWVKPPEPIRGLDHLGAQAPCIALYGQLLPGITNVTDRARYYSFYPWLLWSFERRYQNHSRDELRRVLRRAECLFSLIAIRHAREIGDGDDGRHGKAMVGRDQLMRIDAESRIVLGEYAALDGPHRYFKNPLGGLGQYYFGPLRDLRVLDQQQNALGYDRERGRPLAEALAKGVPEDAFFDALEAPSTTWATLDELSAFCPCQLAANAAEHTLLLDLFFARTPAFHGDGGPTRRASLGLILDLANQPADAGYFFEDVLRGAAYTSALAGGQAWPVLAPFERVRNGWRTYQRNELLSIAVQGLFAAILLTIERDEAQCIGRADAAAEIAVRLLVRGGREDVDQRLDRVVARVRDDLPFLSDWQHHEHEMQRGLRVYRNDAGIEAMAHESIEIILALLARGVDAYPYADFELDPDYFDPQEIHLLSLRRAWESEWQAITLEEWVRWLAVHWGVARHLRVALRKLRGQGRDTFRIRPLEGELRVVEAPAPVFTQPRVSRAQQILRDLGLVDYNDAGALVLTDRGRIELEACCVG